jgi:hypothetical protein
MGEAAPAADAFSLARSSVMPATLAHPDKIVKILSFKKDDMREGYKRL